MLKLIVLAVLFALTFGFGVVTGIADCKRRFSIPKGEMPLE